MGIESGAGKTATSTRIRKSIWMGESPSRSGVFDSGTDQRLARFSESISQDHRLARHDLRGSIAHARMLARQGILTETEAAQIVTALEEIGGRIERGELQHRIELEDIHMHVEQALIDQLGDVGRKLHTGRSRNDQVSTDLRLWTRDAIDRVVRLLTELQRAFLDRCKIDEGIVLPAYTHLQRAQPVLAAHYWLAYTEKLERDRQRLLDARRRVNQCPLGGAAVAGTSLPIDRHWVAKELGFEGVAANSIDISSDRDFAIESTFALSLIGAHLSGWAEEWILWSTVEYGFLKLPHRFCTGSSIMPQKINPDTLELTRGKSARVIGHLQTLLVLIKGLPLAYNRDLQEDKFPLFDSFDTVEACLELAIPIVQQSTLQKPAIQAKLEHGYLDATTVMEKLIVLGMPQRTAHHVVGALVHAAMQRNVPLAELPPETIGAIDPRLSDASWQQALRAAMGADAAVHSYQSYGSSHPQQVAHQIAAWTARLDARPTDPILEKIETIQN